jgi:hypothetical protein
MGRILVLAPIMSILCYFSHPAHHAYPLFFLSCLIYPAYCLSVIFLCCNPVCSCLSAVVHARGLGLVLPFQNSF